MFRFWAASGSSVVLAIVVTLVIDQLQAIGILEDPTGRRDAVEIEFGAQLTGWICFALIYLVLGLRAFAGCDREELVRRVLGSPVPRNWWARYLLAGGGAPTWAVGVSFLALSTIVSAAQDRADSTPLVLALTAGTILTCWMTITFSFALHYARKDIEVGGLAFSGTDAPVFGDYVYLAVGCSATFGTTDTGVTTSVMRRAITAHSVIAFFLNTVVIAVLLSVIVN